MFVNGEQRAKCDFSLFTVSPHFLGGPRQVGRFRLPSPGRKNKHFEPTMKSRAGSCDWCPGNSPDLGKGNLRDS